MTKWKSHPVRGRRKPYDVDLSAWPKARALEGRHRGLRACAVDDRADSVKPTYRAVRRSILLLPQPRVSYKSEPLLQSPLLGARQMISVLGVEGICWTCRQRFAGRMTNCQ